MKTHEDSAVSMALQYRVALSSKNRGEEHCPSVSVVVPVYNARPYLEECLYSIMGQTLEDIEIICVDDGSTDGSGDLLEEISSRDERITVIHHHENLGLPASRKTGIHRAKAPYIGFVDSDDWIDCDMYRVLYACMMENNLDLVTSAMYRETTLGVENRIQTDQLEEKIYETLEDLEDFFSKAVWQENRRCCGLLVSAVTKLYRTDILTESCHSVDNRLKSMEDIALVYTYLFRCKRIQILHTPFYHYRYVEDSDSNQEDPLFLEHVNALYIGLKCEADCSTYRKCIADQVENMVVYTAFSGMNRLMGMSIFNHVLPQFPLRGLRGKRVVVYGAGRYGINTLKRIEKTYTTSCPIRFIGFVDRIVEGEAKGYPVYKPDDINRLDFDYLVVAVNSDSMRSEIRESLTRRGVPLNKVVEIF